MCANHLEYVENYNRITGANISFNVMPRTQLETLIDMATGYTPAPKNDLTEMSAFVAHCIDMYQRIPTVTTP